MPIFNTFRINEELLGRVMASKKNDDLVFISEEEKATIKKLYSESVDNHKSFKQKVIELVIGKKLVKYVGNKGQVRYKLFNPNDEYIPSLKIGKTTDRPLDFKNNIYRWLWYIKALNKRMEKERLKAEEAEKKQLALS